MPIDPALYDMMHGVTPTKKKVLSSEVPINNGHFVPAIEKSIEMEVNRLLADEDPNQNKLLSVQARRAKLAQEMRESLDMSELEKHVSTASDIIRNEGNNYLEKEAHNLLIQGLNSLGKQMLSLDPENLNNETLRTALTLPPNNLSAILKIGIAKFTDGLLQESFSIFAFLSALDSEEPDYWYRLGLVAQKCEQYERALRAFALTSLLAPEFIGVHIFAAECYLKMGQHDDALAEVNEMKHMFETNEVSEEWKARIVDIENLLAFNDTTDAIENN
jgi:tetratricopeptide (TPR) repeat protein